MENKDNNQSEIKIEPNHTIEYHWSSYEQATLKNIPKDSVQYKETKKAFYGGALIIFNTLVDIATKEESYSFSIFTNLQKELSDFIGKVKAGGVL